MSEKIMIIVTGAPATGKVTISNDLANKFNLPVVHEDEIKEMLFDQCASQAQWPDSSFREASSELIYLFAEKMCQTQTPFILEGSFEHKFTTKRLSEIRSRYDYQVLQLYCFAHIDAAYKRFMKRNRSGSRHPGHGEFEMGLNEYRQILRENDYKLKIDGSFSLDIDTTDFKDVNLQQIYDEVLQKLLL